MLISGMLLTPLLATSPASGPLVVVGHPTSGAQQFFLGITFIHAALYKLHGLHVVSLAHAFIATWRCFIRCPYAIPGAPPDSCTDGYRGRTRIRFTHGD